MELVLWIYLDYLIRNFLYMEQPFSKNQEDTLTDMSALSIRTGTYFPIVWSTEHTHIVDATISQIDAAVALCLGVWFTISLCFQYYSNLLIKEG